MSKIIIEDGTNSDIEFVIDKLVEFNLSKVPLSQNEPFIWINKVVKDKNNKIIGGISSKMYCWKCIYVDALWVDEGYKNNGIGSMLLKEIENIAMKNKCKLIHLDTFDFQAKDFYIKHGYEIFGVLDECPENHKRYYMKKVIKY